MPHPRLLLAFALPATLTVNARAAELVRPEPPHVHATRLSQAPVIDGKLDEPLWKDAAIITDFKQIKPGDGTPVSERTEVRVGYDKDNLYIGAHMIDRRGPDAITASVMKQGSRLPDDDRLGIILDPFGTGRGAYRFEVNLNGVRNDMLYQGGQPQGEWTVIWEAAASLTEDGWSAEIALPFKTLPFDPNVEAWGFNISRAIRTRAEEAVWVSRNRAWGPSITGKLTGIKDVDQGRGLDIVPTLGLRSMRYYADDHTDNEANPSLDLYYRLTPSLNASLTLNTDFSATDADDRQVNLTRFSLFFPEKRDFFLKDADLFDFGRIGGSGEFNNSPRAGTRAARESGRPFFSRKLGLSPAGTPVDLDYGGKLSGRVGRWRIGMLTVRQDDYVPTTGATLNASTVGVARIAADVLSESSVGFVGTFGDPGTNGSNSLVGADFLYQNSRFPGGRTLEAEGWIQQSDSSGSVGGQGAFGIGARLIDTAGWRYGASYKQIGRGFRPALGFISRAGIRSVNMDGGYTNLVRGSLVQSVFTGLDAERIEDVNGTLQSQALALRPIEMESSRRDVLKLYYMFNTEVLAAPFTIFSNVNKRVVIPVGRYDFNDYGLDFTTGQQRRLGARINFRRGEFYDGRRLALGGEVSWKQSKHFAIRGSYDFNDITLPVGKFSTRIVSAGADINFSSRLFWTNLFQYDNVSEVAGLQSHLHYIPKAGQEFNLIINKASEDLDRDGQFRSLTAEYGARLSYTLRF
ncbi:MAG: carbohydrate binding family 9 domain-containing protein [Gammaproteobacteria bacterium]|nr:carbohydrate binding family 9 domain-containing protein [Gammaproteobacteria bacterium]